MSDKFWPVAAADDSCERGWPDGIPAIAARQDRLHPNICKSPVRVCMCIYFEKSK